MNEKPWTKESLEHEWKVTYETRLGIMCGNNSPTPKQIHIAKCEADDVIARLKNERTNGITMASQAAYPSAQKRL